MRVPIVRHGDPTTTGGNVVAYSSTMHDDGKKIALYGDQATCGTCKGLWSVVGTGEGVSEQGRVVVIDGDHVLCLCGKNRVIAGHDASCFLHVEHGGSDTATASAASDAQTRFTRSSLTVSNFTASRTQADALPAIPLEPHVALLCISDIGAPRK